MMSSNNQNRQTTRILAWNANGLLKRRSELKQFLLSEDIDIALISETHLTSRSSAEIHNYKMYTCNHPSDAAHGGSAVYIKKSISHYEAPKYCTNSIQAAGVVIQSLASPTFTVAAVYSPPKHSIKSPEYIDFFKHLGQRWIIGGDLNAKHRSWGSRLNSPKGNELYKAINSINGAAISNGSPTYWPSDRRKIPDCIDIFVSKGIATPYTSIENANDLTSDHSPIILTLSNRLIEKPVKTHITNKNTDWDLFRQLVSEGINLRIRLKTSKELDWAVNHIQTILTESAKAATPTPKETHSAVTRYPRMIVEAVRERRKARHRWQSTRDPAEKTRFNKISKKVKDLIRENDNKTFESQLAGLDATKETEYSLWKMARKNKPLKYVPPIRTSDGNWARSDKEKAKAFAEHLEKVFQPNETESDIVPSPERIEGSTIKLFTPQEIKNIIDKLKPRKAPGLDCITTKILQEAPRKALVMLTYIFNAILRLCYFPKAWKMAKIIVIPKPGKSLEDPESYRPISLLATISKVFEKLFRNRLDDLLQELHIIPDYQFGFRRKHASLEQVHRVAAVVRNSLEAKEYCCAVFLDISQAFDKVWIDGLIHKISQYLPAQIIKILESYLLNRSFQVHYGEGTSDVKPILAGVPQGSVLGPLLYVLYTADLPQLNNTAIATFADDTAITATHENYLTATDNLQEALNEFSSWARQWRIKINKSKSKKVDFALRPHVSQPVTLENEIVPLASHTKYLGIHLDQKLNWKAHILKKREEVKLRFRSIFWLFHHKNKLSLQNKRLLYITALRPIWSYGAPLWGCAAESNLEILQRLQNNILRKMTGAPWYVRNDTLHSDLKIGSTKEHIKKIAASYEARLHRHPNTLAIQLLEAPPTARLRRKMPADIL